MNNVYTNQKFYHLVSFFFLKTNMMIHFFHFFNCLFSSINADPTARQPAAACSALPPPAPIAQAVKKESSAPPDSSHNPDKMANLNCSLKTKLEYK